MTKPMTVIEIVADTIKKNGYDGLYDEYGECACELNDLAPCGELKNGCTMGYRHWCDDDGCIYYEGKHWHMKATK